MDKAGPRASSGSAECSRCGLQAERETVGFESGDLCSVCGCSAGGCGVDGVLCCHEGEGGDRLRRRRKVEGRVSLRAASLWLDC